MKRINELKLKESQRAYEKMVQDVRPKDTSLHVRQELKNPMDNAQNAIAAFLGAFTVGFFFYYMTHRSLGEAAGLSLGVISFALMLILETVLIMARFYLADHRKCSLSLKSRLQGSSLWSLSTCAVVVLWLCSMLTPPVHLIQIATLQMKHENPPDSQQTPKNTISLQ